MEVTNEMRLFLKYNRPLTEVEKLEQQEIRRKHGNITKEKLNPKPNYQ